jgi:hypothetical protein
MSPASPVSSNNNNSTMRFRDSSYKNQIWRMQSIFVQYLWVFSTPYSTDYLTIYIYTQVKQCFVHNKQNAQPMNSFLWKKNNVDYGILAPLVANKANVGKVSTAAGEGGGSFVHTAAGVGGAALYILVSIFVHVWSAGCVYRSV